MTANGRAGRRAELAALAAELRAKGMLQREIAVVLGVSRSYASGLCSDPDGVKDRVRKAGYGGRCATCGALTDGSNGRAKAPRFCAKHIWDDPEYREKLTKWPADRILASMRWWNDTFGEPPATTDWNPWQADDLGDPERAHRARRLIAAGKIPWFMTVVHRFGSWNDGLKAAGFEPRADNGGGGNQAHRRLGKVQVAILDILYAHHPEPVRFRDLVDETGEQAPCVSRALQTLNGEVERVTRGLYRIAA